MLRKLRLKQKGFLMKKRRSDIFSEIKWREVVDCNAKFCNKPSRI